MVKQAQRSLLFVLCNLQNIKKLIVFSMDKQTDRGLCISINNIIGRIKLWRMHEL